MATGAFFSQLGGGRQGNSAGSITGSGSASQPRDRQGNAYAPMAPSPAPSGGRQGYSSSFGSAPGSTFADKMFSPQSLSNTFADKMFAPQPTQISPLAGLQSMMDTFYGPQQLLLDDQKARLENQYGYVGLDADYRRGALSRDTDLARRGLANDKNLTGGQLQNLGRLKEILKKQYGLNDRTLQNALGKFGIDEAQMRDQAERQTFDLRSNLTPRGAFNTVANERGTGRIQRDLFYGIGGLNSQRESARLSHEGNRYGLDEKGIGYDNQTLSLQNTLTGLGLQGEKITNALTDGLRQIGLDSMFSLGTLVEAISGVDQQKAQMAYTIYQEAAKLSGLPLGELDQMLKGLGIKPPPRPGTGTVLAPKSTPTTTRGVT